MIKYNRSPAVQIQKKAEKESINSSAQQTAQEVNRKGD